MKVLKLLCKTFSLLKIKVQERKFECKLPYLYIKKNSDTLIIIFSAFTGEKRRYNYIKGLDKTVYDRLYILDVFAYKGSYYLYENGSDMPERLTSLLIKKIIDSYNYKKIYTAGSSKGGTAAIYYGLKFNVEAIFSGACQYNLGYYLHRPDHELIFKSMMGYLADGDGEKGLAVLQSVMPDIIEKNNESNTIVHLFYSKNELTYERQIIDLIKKLRENNIRVIEKVETFNNHEDVGYFFLPYLQSYFVSNE